jgi:glyoxylase-like metal-dependent hydrolase (beta-lactamase superfamily II)
MPDTRAEQLAGSSDMTPVHGTVDVDIPVDVLWRFFTQANLWPRWNSCFTWVHNRDLKLGRQLIWTFEPIRPWYLYKMPAMAKIVEVEPERKVTWEVTAFPGMYARHTYSVEDLGNGRTRFGSWEKGMGTGFRLTKWLWVPHFTFVKDRSLEGARYLESIYRSTGRLDQETVPPAKPVAARLAPLALVPLAGAALGGRRFYTTYIRQQPIRLAPGVYAVLNGGGNSLVVDGGSEVLLVDPKFPPHSFRLRNWVREHVGGEVTTIVNTHYHYDHTQGNALYPRAEIYAHENTRPFAVALDHDFTDRDWWERHMASLPAEEVTGRRSRLRVGGARVELLDPGPAHTHGDLVVYLPDHDIVATGDLLFNGFYPYIDSSAGGASLPGWIEALRALATRYPDALFVPGHGALASARDLTHFANYLEALCDGIDRALERGLSEDEAVKSVDLSRWRMKPMPSLLKGKLIWATRERNIRTVYSMRSEGAKKGRVRK